jgi:hypothetical protein
MSKLEFGKYALMGKDKEKRIYLGFDGKYHHAVSQGFEDCFEKKCTL